MTEAETIAAVNALDCPEAAADGMVYQVWEDGELTLQKGGGLLWQRNLHCIEMGQGGKSLPTGALAHRYGEHSYIFCRDEADASKARSLIFADRG